jgi:hypothetical protein
LTRVEIERSVQWCPEQHAEHRDDLPRVEIERLIEAGSSAQHSTHVDDLPRVEIERLVES